MGTGSEFLVTLTRTQAQDKTSPQTIYVQNLYNKSTHIAVTTE